MWHLTVFVAFFTIWLSPPTRWQGSSHSSLYYLCPPHQPRAWHRAGAHENVSHVVVTLTLIRDGTVLEIHTSMAPHHCDYNIYLIGGGLRVGLGWGEKAENCTGTTIKLNIYIFILLYCNSCWLLWYLTKWWPPLSQLNCQHKVHAQ